MGACFRVFEPGLDAVDMKKVFTREFISLTTDIFNADAADFRFASLRAGRHLRKFGQSLQFFRFKTPILFAGAGAGLVDSVLALQKHRLEITHCF
jgi:hypothetical protein